MIGRAEGVVISREAHLFREAGAFYSAPDWLTAVGADDLRAAVALATRRDACRVSRSSVPIGLGLRPSGASSG